MRVCVFGSSSPKTSQHFLDYSFNLGVSIATHGYICVNGGGSNGVMGAVNKGARSMNGEITGVIHERWCIDGTEDNLITNMIVVGGDDLEVRKKQLLDNGDCVIALPGGVGTLDEIFDCVCGKSLGMKGMVYKPVCLVNVDGFYDGLVMQMDRSHEEGLLYGSVEHHIHIVTNVEAGLEWCAAQYEINKVQLQMQRETKTSSVSFTSSRMSSKNVENPPLDTEISFDLGMSEKNLNMSEKSFMTANQENEDNLAASNYDHNKIAKKNNYDGSIKDRNKDGDWDRDLDFLGQRQLHVSILSLSLSLGLGVLIGTFVTKYAERK